MPPIKTLSPDLVNKIAAGEVIERPASVVKELIENALDAGATRIDIALEEGGARLVRVTDNGSGIPENDLPLAISPHATSKLFTNEDLFHVRSLGFRGEALASIASVSRLRIVSRTADSLEAHELIPANPEDPELHPRPCAAPEGTTVEIRNLFYNVPARRKFLRRPQTECARVTEQLARLALAHPGVAFTLTHNDRPMRNLPSTNRRRDRIADFYGADLADCLIDIARDERGLRIEGLIAPPPQSRASTKWQYLFLNGRFIADRRLGYAVREAYRGLVEHDRFPVVFLFLNIDPAEFDVNVHPTKIEVRWRDAGLIQSQVLAFLRDTMLNHDWTPTVSLGRTDGDRDQTPVADTEQQQRVRHALADSLKRIDPTQTRLAFPPPSFSTQRLRPSIAGTLNTGSTKGHSPAGVTETKDDREMDVRPDLSGEGSTSNDSGEAVSTSEIPDAEPNPQSENSNPQYASSSVIQVHNTYLVAQTVDGVIIIDQHALHERILYEQFRERILAGPLESQGLLIPETLDVSPAQIEAAEQHRETLHTLGIGINAFGPLALAVQSFPTLLHSVDIKTFVGDLLDRLAESGETDSEETLLHTCLDMMACKAAVKAGDPLSTEEIHVLLEQRKLTHRASNCPHGRPTTLELSTHDLEKQFKRA
ncbi:MAG: DNA mismatch repair endonuclease MutL [Phycisphaerae bacterium]